MHNVHSPQRELAIRAFKYFIMTLAVAVGVILSLFWAMGYRFNFNDRQISRVALLQFGSFPSNANIYLNDNRLSASTSARLNVEAGENTVRFSREDYRSWQRTVYLLPGEVRWLNYARLIPNTITTSMVREFSDIKQMLVSPDRNWLIIRTSDNDRHVDDAHGSEATNETSFLLTLADISNSQNVRFSYIEVPADKTQMPSHYQAEKFEIIEWSSDSRYILVRHTIDESEEFLLIDRRNPNQVINLNRNLNQYNTEIVLRNIKFSANSGNGLWALLGYDNCLVRIMPNNNFISDEIDCGVKDFTVSSDNKIALISVESTNLDYGSESEAEEKLQFVKIYDGRNITIIRERTKSATLKIDIARFKQQDFLVIGEGEVVTIYQGPIQNLTNNPIYLSSPGGIDWLNISPGGRFIVAGRGGRIVSYDLEVHSNYSFEVSDNASLRWLDNYRLITNNNDQIQIVEFDGANRENIVSGFGNIALSRNERFLFSLSNQNGNVILQRSQLVLD